MNLIVVVENWGPEQELLSNALNYLFPDVQGRFVTAGGRRYLGVVARSALLSSREPTLVVCDAETADPEAVDDRRKALLEELRWVSSSALSDVVTAVPELDPVVLLPRATIQRLIGAEISDLEWEYARENPKRFWQRRGPDARAQVIAHIGPQEFDEMADHTVFRQIRDFVEHMSLDLRKSA